jgi:hypothetical protein
LRKTITLVRDIRDIEHLGGAGLDGIATFGNRRTVLAEEELVATV